MKRFQFSLETLLSLRREKEQECEIALARAVGELAAVDRKIADAMLLGEQAFSRNAPTLDDLRAREGLWNKSMNDQRALEEPRRKAAGRVEESRKIYTRAHTERAALDKLREKRREDWRKEAKREEINRLDEAAKGLKQRQLAMGGDE